MELFSHNYCTAVATYFTATYLVVQLPDVSLRGCKLGLTASYWHPHQFLALDQIHETMVPPPEVKNTALDVAAALGLKIDPEFKCCV
jgi:hypothetical protein